MMLHPRLPTSATATPSGAPTGVSQNRSQCGPKSCRGSGISSAPRIRSPKADRSLQRSSLRPLLFLGPAAGPEPRAGPEVYAHLRLQSRPESPRRGVERVKAEPTALTPEQAAFLVRQRVARLGTSGEEGEPHVVPVCFAYTPGSIYIALDEKPKDVPPTQLKRVRNILENPQVALVADRYAEDWDLLAFVMVRGQAKLVEAGTEEQAAAVRLLRGKYHQYERMKIEENPVISIRPERAASWGALDTPDGAAEPLMNALLGRRSVRRYLNRGVPEEVIVRVLEAARWAPSPHGRQPWRFA